ncbi:reverse transcriptase domain-containing protein [Tanacetum coccineum]
MNSGICSPGGKDGEMYYGQLQEILEFLYLSFKVVLFRVKWFDTSNEGRKVKHLVLRNNMTQILTKGEAFKDDQYILATQVKQCFYLEDMARRQPHWKVVEHVNHKKFSDGGVIVVEEDPDVIHFDNSSDLPLSTSLNDLDNATLHIDGQSTEVDAPPDIIDLDEDDDIIDDEDALPHDLADSDDEDLVNVDDDDGVDVMSADVARGHGGDGGGDDRPPTHHIPTGCGGCFANRGKGTRKPNLGGRKAGRLHTRQETRNLGLKKITNDKGPVPIRFEWDDKKTMMPLGDHASHWSNYLGELIKEMLDKDWGSDVPRALPRQIGMPNLPFGMIPGTKPEPLKIAKTRQRARSYASRDPGHFLAFEIRWKFNYLVDLPTCTSESTYKLKNHAQLLSEVLIHTIKVVTFFLPLLKVKSIFNGHIVLTLWYHVDASIRVLKYNRKSSLEERKTDDAVRNKDDAKFVLNTDSADVSGSTSTKEARNKYEEFKDYYA